MFWRFVGASGGSDHRRLGLRGLLGTVAVEWGLRFRRSHALGRQSRRGMRGRGAWLPGAVYGNNGVFVSEVACVAQETA